MRRREEELAHILFGIYAAGEIDHIVYAGKYKDMSENTKKNLEKIELEDLADIRECAYGVKLQALYKELEENDVLEIVHSWHEKTSEGCYPVISIIHDLIAGKYFTVLKDGKKISASLYATPQKMMDYLYPLVSELMKGQTGKVDDTVIQARRYSDIIGNCNPFYHALKKEFPNTDLQTLCLVIADYVKEKFNIDQELFSRSFNNIPNWRDLFPRTKKDLEPLIAFARKRITAPQFIPTPNNNATNGIIAALVKPADVGQVDINNNLEITVSKSLTLTFEDIKDIQTPKTVNGMKLLIMLLQQYLAHPDENGDVQIPLSKIQSDMGFSDYATTWKAIRKAIEELSKIGFEIKDRSKSSGYIRLNAGVFFIKKGVLYWRFTQEFIPWIVGRGCYIADVPQKVLSTKNPNTFYLWYYISVDHRRNITNESRKISVKSLIDCCPDIKENYEKGNRPRQLIMKPLVEGLEAMDGFYFDWYDSTGKKIDDIWTLKTDDFFNCSIQVDFSDFPKHEKLIEKRKTRIKQEQAAYDKEKAKQKIKREEAAAI